MAREKITDEQFLREREEGLTLKQIAEKYGVNVRNVEIRSSKLAKQGHNHGSPHVARHIPDGFRVKGTSTMIRANGEEVVRWVKSAIDHDKLEQQMQAFHDAFCDELPREDPKPISNIRFENSLSLYPVFDLHIGAMAHKNESGENYSTALAEKVMNQFFDYATAASPDSSRAVLLIGGDFLHYDGMDSVTPTSGHNLDADSRYQKLVYVAMRATRRAVSKMLEKHEKIDIEIIPGNHDLSGMVWLRAAMAAIYENEPRVDVNISPAALHVTHFGKTLIGYCHGHEMKKADTRLSTLARDHRAAFGASEYVYTHSGHWHHQTITEHNLGIDEVHGQLGAKDAYSANGGYRSYRQASVIVYSPDFGEIGRFTCRPEMFNQ